MSTPGYSAEASLDRSGRCYRANRRANHPVLAQVTPAVLILVDGVPWGTVEGSVYGIIGWDNGGGSDGGGFGSGCTCLEYETVCSTIINCDPGAGCHQIWDCHEVCVREQCWA